jgi:hypothetical protein
MRQTEQTTVLRLLLLMCSLQVQVRDETDGTYSVDYCTTTPLINVFSTGTSER